MDRQEFKARTACVLAATALLCGCSSSVVVESSFPAPLVEPLPVRVGLIFSPELHDYIYTEDIPEQSTWTITLGDANIAMLEPLFDTMFMETREVPELPLNAADQRGLDGVIRPMLEKFEFDVPIGQRDQFVEVWMQYKLSLYEPNGEVVTEWPVTGYGKAELGHNREDAVRKAAIVAMREVGATISTQFASQPQVTYWLEERENAAGLPTETQVAN
jgi:hypothetical protein